MRNLKTSPHIRAALLALILLALALTGCVRTVLPVVTPTTEPLPEFTPTPTEVVDPAPADPEPAATEPPAPTETPAPTSTTQPPTPTFTTAPTETSPPDETTPPEETPADGTAQPSPTAEPQPTSSLPQIDPEAEFHGAHHIDTMDDINLWTDESGTLPDNQYIKLEMVDGVMYVTGKRSLWDTWWRSGFDLVDFYIEMDVNTGDCEPDDAYGMILRASQADLPATGYLIGYTCGGEVFARRLDSVSPYVATAILLPTETDLIYSGPNQNNTFGVLMDGEELTIYVNRRYFTTLTDDTFPWGRFGIFVSAGDTGNFTFSIDEIRSWGTGE